VQKYMEFPLLAPLVQPLQQPTEETGGGTGIGIGIGFGMGASAGGIAMKGLQTGSVGGFSGTSAQTAAAAAAVRSSLPSLQPTLPQQQQQQQQQRGAKFDLRVWVLLTACSSHKLEAHIFTQVYGRRCSAQYSSDVSRLHDRYVHLTNYSVQKKQKFGAAATASSSSNSSSNNALAVGTAGGSSGIPSSVMKLRTTINHTRTAERSCGDRKESGTREQGKTANSSERDSASEGNGDEDEEEEEVDENSDGELDWEECSEKVVGRANMNTPSEVNGNASSGDGSNSFIKRKKKKFGHSQSGSADKSARAVLTEAELLMCKSVPVLSFLILLGI
jgi:hypothetical protein